MLNLFKRTKKKSLLDEVKFAITTNKVDVLELREHLLSFGQLFSVLDDNGIGSRNIVSKSKFEQLITNTLRKNIATLDHEFRIARDASEEISKSEEYRLSAKVFATLHALTLTSYEHSEPTIEGLMANQYGQSAVDMAAMIGQIVARIYTPTDGEQPYAN